MARYHLEAILLASLCALCLALGTNENSGSLTPSSSSLLSSGTTASSAASSTPSSTLSSAHSSVGSSASSHSSPSASSHSSPSASSHSAHSSGSSLSTHSSGSSSLAHSSSTLSGLPESSSRAESSDLNIDGHYSPKSEFDSSHSSHGHSFDGSSSADHLSSNGLSSHAAGPSLSPQSMIDHLASSVVSAANPSNGLGGGNMFSNPEGTKITVISNKNRLIHIPGHGSVSSNSADNSALAAGGLGGAAAGLGGVGGAAAGLGGAHGPLGGAATGLGGVHSPLGGAAAGLGGVHSPLAASVPGVHSPLAAAHGPLGAAAVPGVHSPLTPNAAHGVGPLLSVRVNPAAAALAIQQAKLKMGNAMRRAQHELEEKAEEFKKRRHHDEIEGQRKEHQHKQDERAALDRQRAEERRQMERAMAQQREREAKERKEAEHMQHRMLKQEMQAKDAQKKQELENQRRAEQDRELRDKQIRQQMRAEHRMEEGIKKKDEQHMKSIHVQWQDDYSNFGVDFQGPKLDLWQNMCFISGVGHGHGGTVAKAGEACRPMKRLIFNVQKGGESARVDMLPDGRIMVVAGGAPGWVSLSGIFFTKDSPQPLSLTNGWHPYGAEYRPPVFAHVSDFCYASGIIKDGRWSQLASVPEECHPDNRLIFSVNNHERSTRVDVRKNGQVIFAGGGQGHGWVSLDGVLFTKHSGQPLQLANGWTNYGHEYRAASWLKVGSVCSLSGLIQSSQPQETIAQLSEECYPSKRLIFAAAVPNRAARIDVTPNGEVVYVSGGTQPGANVVQWLSLDNVKFVISGPSAPQHHGGFGGGVHPIDPPVPAVSPVGNMDPQRPALTPIPPRVYN